MTGEGGEQTLNDDEARGIIETSRWHIIRYDGLRASVATRASFVISADTVLIGGVALLFPNAIAQQIPGGAFTRTLLGACAIAVLAVAVLSIFAAVNALLAGKVWRDLYGAEPPAGLFYLHSDTFKEVADFPAFFASFKTQTLQEEARHVSVCLWVVMRTMDYRYKFLRTATKRLRVGFSIFSGSVLLVTMLSIIELWLH